MRNWLCIGLAAAFLLPAAQASKEAPTQAEISTIIAKFAAKESDFARARENYTYRQSMKIQEIDADGRPGGKREMVSDIIFTSDGKRTERVVRAPVDSLRNILITPEDEQDLRNVQPFVLTTKDIDKYLVRYLGHETLDEIGCYAFAVKPKKMEPGERYFEGIVWVDDRDLQIVKTYGRGIGLLKKHSDNQFPKFETYREQIDGKYWFPTYTHADSVLNFQSGPQRIRLTVRYEDYKQFKGEAIIKYGDVVTEPPAKPAEPKKP
ncbi:MAG: hypothetical protein IT160_13215 [Bryobacterales bacterium]|nr:hypothetical protein [Bryobacterales bacterium]